MLLVFSFKGIILSVYRCLVTSLHFAFCTLYFELCDSMNNSVECHGVHSQQPSPEVQYLSLPEGSE